MNQPRSKELLVRALVEVIVGSTTPIEMWGQLVFSGNSGDFARRARVTAFPLLFCCMRDIIEAGPKNVRGIADEAKLANYGSLYLNATRFEERCKLAVPVLQILTEDEQILMALLRDRFAHGYLSGTTQQNRKIKVLRNNTIQSVEFDRSDLIHLAERQMPDNNLMSIDTIIQKTAPEFKTYVEKTKEYWVSETKLTDALMRDGLVIFNSN